MVLARHLFTRVMHKGRVIGLLALSSVPGLVYWLAGFDADPGDLAEMYSDIVASVGYTFAIAALIVSTATLREERDNGTLPYLYMRPIARSSISTSSLAAGAGAALVLAVGGWISTLIAALLIGTDLDVVMPGLALFSVAAVGYSAIFVPLGYLVPRSLLVGLGYIVIVESILGNAVDGLAHISIWRISMSAYAALATELGEVSEQVLGPVEAGAGGALVKVGAVLLVGMITLIWALRKRDAL